MSEHSDENTGVISYRLTAIEKAMSSMSDSMRQLVILEQKHLETREALGRAFVLIEAQEKRIRELEDNHQKLDGVAKDIETHAGRITMVEGELPTLKLARGWVISGVIGVIAMFALTLIRLYVK